MLKNLSSLIRKVKAKVKVEKKESAPRSTLASASTDFRRAYVQSFPTTC
jgi:hypothetical protein